MEISRELSRRVKKLSFAAPVTHTYNPLEYARAPHESYLRKYGNGPKQVILVGMNPGPFGMAQTGVPFGDVSIVRDWMGIEEPVPSPKGTHSKRPILGFACERKEVSGTRLWGWARERFETPERFFAQFFVVNYCPLVFLEESGRNRTPDKLASEEREALFAFCDRALEETLLELSPQHVVGVGGFAAKRVEAVLKKASLTKAKSERFQSVQASVILHPSPANPHANRGWAERIEPQLREVGIDLPAESA